MRIINLLLTTATYVLAIANVQAQKNPVLLGLYADPEVLYSEQTGRYYIYPTTDGQRNWTGHDFHVFESRDMKHWEEKGRVLDLRKDVSWADNNAWAPCIIERKQTDGSYRHYFYYTAEGQIGVAVGTTPTGPFTDSGRPLIDKERPEGMGHGANIDPDVFQDPQTGKCFLYWGNGYLAVAELADDMVSLVPGTTRLIINSKQYYSEGSYVFYRKGWYYFMWSKNDTRSPEYHVRYCRARSPLGPINPAESRVVIQQRPDKGIYATGHHSVVCHPKHDRWWIVYHRFQRPDAIKLGRDAGYNREVCIDRMKFDKDGNIIEVTPKP